MAEIRWEPTGFIGSLGTSDPKDENWLYLVELKRESAGRWEWWIEFRPTGERIAEGVTRLPDQAKRAAAKAVWPAIAAHVEKRKAAAHV